jgi:hypothetical protein
LLARRQATTGVVNDENLSNLKAVKPSTTALKENVSRDPVKPVMSKVAANKTIITAGRRERTALASVQVQPVNN